MRISRNRRRTGVVAAAFAATLVSGLAAAPAAQADDTYVPPLGCGVMFHEVGPISAAVHDLEPLLRPVRLGPVMLEHQLHGVNCGIVLNLEYALGLQTRPWIGIR